MPRENHDEEEENNFPIGNENVKDEVDVTRCSLVKLILIARCLFLSLVFYEFPHLQRHKKVHENQLEFHFSNRLQRRRVQGQLTMMIVENMFACDGAKRSQESWLEGESEVKRIFTPQANKLAAKENEKSFWKMFRRRRNSMHQRKDFVSLLLNHKDVSPSPTTTEADDADDDSFIALSVRFVCFL